MKYHPDRNPNDPQAAEKFKEVSEAYRAITEGRAGHGWSHDGSRPHPPPPPGSGGGFPRGGFPGGGFPGGDERARRLFEELFGNLDDVLRQMERQNQRGGFPGSGFGRMSRTMQQQIIVLPDGRRVMRTTITTVKPDGSHHVETRDEELPSGPRAAGYGPGPGAKPAGFPGQGADDEALRRMAAEARKAIRSALWQATKQLAGRAMNSIMRGLLGPGGRRGPG